MAMTETIARSVRRAAAGEDDSSRFRTLADLDSQFSNGTMVWSEVAMESEPDEKPFGLSLLPDYDALIQMHIPDDEERVDRDWVLRELQKLIPGNAVFVGRMRGEMGDMVSWIVDHCYYLLPIKKEGWNWGLLGLVWNEEGCDEPEHWSWTVFARIKGVPHPRVAARMMLQFLFAKWMYDTADPEFTCFKEFVDWI